MAATLAAARGAFPGRRLVLAFQPHRYTRTRDLFEDFVKVLSSVDALLLTEVYPAGEAPIVAADGRALARAMRVGGKIEPIFVEHVGGIAARDSGCGAGRRRGAEHGRGFDRPVAGTDCGGGAVRTSQSEELSHSASGGALEQPVTARGEVRLNEPMAKHVSWRAGGVPSACMCRPTSTIWRNSCAACRLTAGVFVGLGSNLLVRDGGVQGVVVLLHGALKRIALESRLKGTSWENQPIEGYGVVYAEAGVATPKLARFAASHDLVGAEFLAGIPGTVGGALAMNAGCYGTETWDVAAQVLTLDRQGHFTERSAADYTVGYRHVALNSGAEEWFVGGWFRLRVRRWRSIAAAHQGIVEPAHRQPAAESAQCRLGIPQSAGRFRCAPDRGHAA